MLMKVEILHIPDLKSVKVNNNIYYYIITVFHETLNVYCSLLESSKFWVVRLVKLNKVCRFWQIVGLIDVLFFLRPL